MVKKSGYLFMSLTAARPRTPTPRRRMVPGSGVVVLPITASVMANVSNADVEKLRAVSPAGAVKPKNVVLNDAGTVIGKMEPSLRTTFKVAPPKTPPISNPKALSPEGRVIVRVFGPPKPSEAPTRKSDEYVPAP